MKAAIVCWAIAGFASVVLAAAKESYVAPPAGTRSLIREISAKRNPDGTVTISGVILLPRQTKIWVERYSASGRTLAQAETRVGFDGVFSAGPFSDDGKAPKPGRQRVGVAAHFNGFWQKREILSVIGEGGRNLPASALRPDDPEFPNAARHLQETRTIEFPAASSEIVAIDRVKNAKLYVQGKGQAVDTVGFIVGEFGKAPGFRPISWSARKVGAKWLVTLDCQDGPNRKQAQWEYDAANGKVRYLDPLSKILSWMPAE